MRSASIVAPQSPVSPCQTEGVIPKTFPKKSSKPPHPKVEGNGKGSKCVTTKVAVTPRKTFVMFLLDESGSMSHGMGITIHGYNKQVDLVKLGAAENGEVYMSLLKFSSPPVEEAYLNQPAERLDKLSADNYHPSGSTALFDAIGRGLEILEDSPGVSDPDSAVLFIIFTDGAENSSTLYTGPQLKKLIDARTETGKWTFTLIGPDLGLDGLATILSIDKGNISGFNPNALDSRAESFERMAGATSTYFGLRAMGATAASNLYSGKH